MVWCWRQILRLRRAVCAEDSPRRLALGVALGLVLGLAPKGNLLAVLIATTLYASRANLATGLFSAVVFGLVAPFCDPLTHRVGAFVLTHPVLLPVWLRLEDMPLAAWTDFNNTVVMGSLVVATILAYPAYRLTLPWMIRRQKPIGTVPATPAALMQADEPVVKTGPIGRPVPIHSARPPTVASRVAVQPRRRSA